MMFHKKLSRWFRLLTATLLVAMLWMVAMVVYFDRAVSHDRSRSKDQRSSVPMRNKLRGILGHDQDSYLDHLDFVQNVIVIADESLEDRKISLSTNKKIDSGKEEFEIDSSGPFYIDSKNDLRHVTKEDHFQFGPGRKKVLRVTTLGSRGQILPSLQRDKVYYNRRTTKSDDFGHILPPKQSVMVVTNAPTTQIAPTLRKPEFSRLSLPFCAFAKGCYLSPYRSMTADEERDLDHGMKRHAFNVRASEKKALDRRIPDTRPSSCLSQTFKITDLPSASIIICFHNEALSTLLRTLTTVFLRTPSQLLKEVILVDDASDFDYLQSKIENYINSSSKIKLIRQKDRKGLIRARMIGAKAATGSVLVFLDSHCECNTGWLEPLLDEIRLDKKQIVCPDVDVIKPETFDYVRAPRNVHGSFDWNLNFQWENLPHSVMYKRQTEANKIPTPVMIGGLFAVDRQYFFNIGAYDEDMGVWGGENLEISFRVWMCGGQIEIIPCSRVGHVFRRTIPYTFPNGSYLTIRRNLVRVAEVWMDRYKKYYYASRALPPDLDIGIESLAIRKRLRERLKCHDFDWYLRTVAVGVDVPPIYALYYGEVKNKRSGMCLDSLDADEGAQPLFMICHGQRGNQLFYLTVNGDFIHSDVCLAMSPNGDTVIFVACDSTPTKWIFTNDGQLQVLGHDKCLTVSNLAVELTSCIGSNHSQMWTFTYHFDYSLLKEI
ncbi:polypeptide N-acetylgalactosaminyltransferase 13-like [Lineus longissimus]|uniref:polypeptide N-acetylgalactosaminyltransferase 13-like n=1 Tax=Lineus longissimus TaxID=88925 RepID=UPI002B4DEF3A